ncbi:MAG: hypothetical protein MIO92_14790, partial [Methanosarcinaceae archaeon]|nr:hypothetical protein [Methanosarcinaceae archaeon]
RRPSCALRGSGKKAGAPWLHSQGKALCHRRERKPPIHCYGIRALPPTPAFILPASCLHNIMRNNE